MTEIILCTIKKIFPEDLKSLWKPETETLYSDAGSG